MGKKKTTGTRPQRPVRISDEAWRAITRAAGLVQAKTGESVTATEFVRQAAIEKAAKVLGEDVPKS